VGGTAVAVLAAVSTKTGDSSGAELQPAERAERITMQIRNRENFFMASLLDEFVNHDLKIIMGKGNKRKKKAGPGAYK
jgi:hypothetical protein